MVSEVKSKALNKAFRKRAQSATTLSFPFIHKKDRVNPKTKLLHLGEIVMAPTLIIRRARMEGVSARSELTRHFVHAMLHLLGYNHEGKGKKFVADGNFMERFEQKIVSHISQT